MSKIECSDCGRVVSREEDFLDISVEVPKSLRLNSSRYPLRLPLFVRRWDDLILSSGCASDLLSAAHSSIVFCSCHVRAPHLRPVPLGRCGLTVPERLWAVSCDHQCKVNPICRSPSVTHGKRQTRKFGKKLPIEVPTSAELDKRGVSPKQKKQLAKQVRVPAARLFTHQDCSNWSHAF